MKHTFTFLSLLALAGNASAALVTNGWVQNKESNWSHHPGAIASGSTENVPSSLAIDGNYNGNWSGGSVTHTTPGGPDAGAFWMVDLGAQRPITDVTLFNRTDCCSNRLTNVSLQASTDAGFTNIVYDSGNNAGIVTSFPGVNQTARYVRVYRNALADDGTTVISLAEVDVLGAAQFNYANLAPGSTASQSSTLANAANPTADKAIDGNLTNSFGSGSTTHTNPGGAVPVYWETLLAAKSNINEISLYNRGDCCPDRLSNFRVSVFDGGTEVFGQDYFVGTGQAGNIFSIQEDAGGFFATGDRVRVELIGGLNNGASGQDVLSLREVEIYGVAIPEPSAFALFGLGGLGLILRRRRK